jgi:hypothetical protein
VCQDRFERPSVFTIHIILLFLIQSYKTFTVDKETYITIEVNVSAIMKTSL